MLRPLWHSCDGKVRDTVKEEATVAAFGHMATAFRNAAVAGAVVSAGIAGYGYFIYPMLQKLRVDAYAKQAEFRAADEDEARVASDSATRLGHAPEPGGVSK